MTARPLRILHAVYHLDVGGIESWLLNVLRHIDQQEFRLDFLVHGSGANDELFSKQNADVIRVPRPAAGFAYRREFRKALLQHGRYDIIHTHVTYAGYLLPMARRAGVHASVVHSHCDDRQFSTIGSPITRMIINRSLSSVRRQATAGLACSSIAARAMFGADWQSDRRWKVLPYGSDLTPYAPDRASRLSRESLGIPDSAICMVNVARFHPQKNHLLLIEIAKALLEREPRAFFVLVGDGELRPNVEQQIRQAGIGDRFRLLGARRDVPDILMSCADVFLFPTRYEGLGLAVVEAQVAGVPCVVSEAVPPEATVEDALVSTIRLQAPTDEWVNAVLAAASRKSPQVQSRVFEKAVGDPNFNIHRQVKAIEDLYSRVADRDESGHA